VKLQRTQEEDPESPRKSKQATDKGAQFRCTHRPQEQDWNWTWLQNPEGKHRSLQVLPIYHSTGRGDIFRQACPEKFDKFALLVDSRG
jgi:hypothetical protein